MNLVPVGKLLRPHGLKGEIKVLLEEGYEEDFLQAGSFLAGKPPAPLFIASFRGGGALIIKLEGIDSREAVQPLSQATVYLPEDRISDRPAEVQDKMLQLVGYSIRAEGYSDLGPIEEVMDLPQHYLAKLDVEGQEVLIPLHDDLILSRNDEDKELVMRLPEGLLD
ncbi:MAG: ribosome maturation factor RimM [Bacteroidota bacterium]